MVSSRPIDPLLRAIAYVTICLISLPILALIAKVPWSSFLTSLSANGSLTSVWLSIWTSVLAACISLLLGVPLAWWLVKADKKITKFIRPLVLAPIALPPTVAGLALLGLLSRKGLIGEFVYSQTGWQMPFTTSAVVFTGLFIGIPFLVLITESTFAMLPDDVEDAAVVDRASQSQLFRLIALPQAREGIVTGLLLAWARILGEFGATMMFAGSLAGVTQTWTIQIYQQLDISPDTAYALSFLMVIIAMAIFVLIRKPLKDAFTR
jgi:molybdate transport system permease protein